MLKVGLTGGIAAGKSVAGEMFATQGAKVIRADDIAHNLMQPGQPVYEAVVERFGRDILNPDGSVNRSRLAEAAFGNGTSSPRVEELNRIVHPAVVKRQEEWMDEVGRDDRRAVAIVEAALILEAGAWKRFDRMVVVTCGSKQRIERWAGRVKTDLESARREVERRMAAQLPDEEKIKAADYVIDNSGSLDRTRQQVVEIYKQLKAESRDRAQLGIAGSHGK